MPRENDKAIRDFVHEKRVKGQMMLFSPKEFARGCTGLYGISTTTHGPEDENCSDEWVM